MVVPFVALKFVANDVDAFRVASVDDALMSVAKFAVPEKVGDAEKTRFPVPVSSVRSAASSADVSIEDEDTFSANCLKLSAERIPESVVDETSGMLSVWMLEAELKPKPALFDVVAKVCDAPVWPLSDVRVPRPSDEVDVHRAVAPFESKSCPFVPSDEALSESDEILRFVVVALVIVANVPSRLVKVPSVEKSAVLEA